ncbi:MAG TPA: ATP-binding cassette domain-containing protein [Solirubrobacteraceae bacterium]|nr:ATP-binding cassette domain-containing protein [Solirubrobacteraceae bacterium]
MSLLAAEHVGKRYREGRRERTVLDDVSLALHEGELVVIYGERRCGRSTLLRILAGIEAPDSGTVRFQGRDLAGHGEESLGAGIGYVRKCFRAGEEQSVLAQVATPLLARGISVRQAQLAARSALQRTGAERCAGAVLSELGAGETVRVTLARALVLSPLLVVIDEPAAGVELSQRDGVLAQLRTLAGEGTAVLAATGEPSELAGAHRALTLSDGRLRGPAVPELARVLPLRAGA